MAEFANEPEHDPSQGNVNFNLPFDKLHTLEENNLLVIDQWTTGQIVEDPLLAGSEIRQSHLLRLTNITRHEAGTDMIRIERDWGVVEMFMREDDFDAGAGFRIQSEIRNEQYAIHDSIDGWKAKLLKTRPREVTINETQPKKKGWFGF
jgi:hypothetical protein